MVISRLEVCFSLLSVQCSRGGSLPRTSSQIVPMGLRNASPSGHKHPVFKGHPLVYMLGQNHNRGTQDRASPQHHWVGRRQKWAEEHRASGVGDEATRERWCGAISASKVTSAKNCAHQHLFPWRESFNRVLSLRHTL